MPYKRYDITNTYSYRGRRKNENVVLKTVMLIVIPLVIIAVLLGGAYVSYLVIINEEKDEPRKPVATTDEALLHEEELLRVVNESDPLEADYVPELSEYKGVKINTLALDSLAEMIEEAEKAGISLDIKAGYVSFDEQAKLHKATFEKLKKSGNNSQIKKSVLPRVQVKLRRVYS